MAIKRQALPRLGSAAWVTCVRDQVAVIKNGTTADQLTHAQQTLEALGQPLCLSLPVAERPRRSPSATSQYLAALDDCDQVVRERLVHTQDIQMACALLTAPAPITWSFMNDRMAVFITRLVSDAYGTGVCWDAATRELVFELVARMRLFDRDILVQVRRWAEALLERLPDPLSRALVDIYLRPHEAFAIDSQQAGLGISVSLAVRLLALVRPPATTLDAGTRTRSIVFIQEVIASRLAGTEQSRLRRERIPAPPRPITFTVHDNEVRINRDGAHPIFITLTGTYWLSITMEGQKAQCVSPFQFQAVRNCVASWLCAAWRPPLPNLPGVCVDDVAVLTYGTSEFADRFQYALGKMMKRAVTGRLAQAWRSLIARIPEPQLSLYRRLFACDPAAELLYLQDPRFWRATDVHAAMMKHRGAAIVAIRLPQLLSGKKMVTATRAVAMLRRWQDELGGPDPSPAQMATIMALPACVSPSAICDLRHYPVPRPLTGRLELSVHLAVHTSLAPIIARSDTVGQWSINDCPHRPAVIQATEVTWRTALRLSGRPIPRSYGGVVGLLLEIWQWPHPTPENDLVTLLCRIQIQAASRWFALGRSEEQPRWITNLLNRCPLPLLGETFAVGGPLMVAAAAALARRHRAH